ncbi:MAG: histone deacetylase family protein [Candidatus Aenigmarchaeota archaeon]|nr:histone deacetylase family protein [Candidatus Aenigmarchaeota archaeon]
MIRIRKIHDGTSKRSKKIIGDVRALMLALFPLEKEKAEEIALALNHPEKYGFRSILFVVEGIRGNLRGFAILSYFPKISFCYLDFMGINPKYGGRGIGGALYSVIRKEAKIRNCKGLFFECLPDDPKLCSDPKILRQNISRLKFYERYGARPIAGTKYETPVNPKKPENPPYLVYDDLDSGRPLSRDFAREVVRGILERKYEHLCGTKYNEMVLSSFSEDPVRLRSYKYSTPSKDYHQQVPERKKIALIVNEDHKLHHVPERGYVESPVRIRSILASIEKMPLFRKFPREVFSDRHILEVHSPEFFRYLKKICIDTPPEKSIYPYVFPIRNSVKKPKDLDIRAGYYCIDTFTPLNRNAFIAARSAVNSALTGAKLVNLNGGLAYALTRPPGHHVEKKSFGGFCYLNSAAIAANYLSKAGKVAILDIDYHHGNGQQVIFYGRKDVLTISLHGHPSFAYPYFSGFAEEKGEGLGKGHNLNFPLKEDLSFEEYRGFLEKALKRISRFAPDHLVVALGFDTSKNDPTGSWKFESKDFRELGLLIGSLRIPTLVVQEGGYNTVSLGENAAAFFSGLWQGYYGAGPESKSA